MSENGLRKLFRIKKLKLSCQLLGSTIKQHINMYLAFLVISFHKNFKYKYLVRTAESWTLNDGNWQSSSIINLHIADGIVACKFNKPREVEIIKLVHIYYSPESHSVYNYFSFVFAFDILCVFFVFFFFFDIYSRTWLRTKFDWCLIDMYSIPIQWLEHL
jgi:hypothetical protein